VTSPRPMWSPASYRSLLPNMLGSSALAVDAVHEAQWGFVLLSLRPAIIRSSVDLPQP